MIKILLVVVLSIAVAEGAGEGTASILDLKWPFVNFVILFGFLFWKIKKPLTDMFNKNAVEVEKYYNLAQEKDKEAQIKLEMYRNKMEVINSECGKIVEESRREALKFETKYKKDIEALTERLKQDRNNRIEFEKKQLLQKMTGELIDEMLAKTKAKITTDGNIRSKVTDGLLCRMDAL